MFEARLPSLELSSKDNTGKALGDYMSERILMTDMEVGVHEAWEDMVSCLLPPPAYTSHRADHECGPAGNIFDVEAQFLDLHIDNADILQLPGAFPTVSVEEVEFNRKICN